MATKRIMADIRELESDIYKSSGIYYIPTESNLFHGYACIFGPKDSCYEGCPMVYEVTLPQSYPFEPPTLKFLTYDGKTRFHPNMYVDGKVCLSILHTWSGPKWASTMKISTVLVTLQSLMDNDPLRHEPGFHIGRHSTCKAYANAVKTSCINYQLFCLENPITHKGPDVFKEIIREIILKNISSLENFCNSLEEVQDENIPYGLKALWKKEDLLRRVRKLKG
jgi:ubiquitin-conjugating enzyme E2 Z